MHLGQVFSHISWGLMEERKTYQLNAPTMGGEDSGKKWRRKVVEPQMDNLWGMLFPMTKSGRKEIQERKETEAKSRKEKLQEVREGTNG